MRASSSVFGFIVAGVLAVLAGAAVAGGGAQQVAIAPELARLADAYGFTVTGDEHLADAVGRAEGDDPFHRVRILLENFDNIIVQDGHGGVERVIVLGAATPGAAPREPLVSVDGGTQPEAPIELRTIRQGNQHAVRVALEADSGRRLARLLLIDTGADALVLPESLIARLGIDANTLTEREVQTANGLARARTGRLAAVWLDSQRVPDVAVAFLEDDKLGNPGLLGMGVLGRYQMTIDDQANRLTLTIR
ncbi:MAG: retroviral-like aspartic protease family protein [Thiohalocapsa sp.]|jgi:clan AA aspartic protease (TIGR02281 family)|uniref:retropepsin-like aspartic protease family protein n=1 Tax=Thiohalocapsa sp. TaxID=2497641 RepID=UPI0025CF7B7C|nr:retropepsin-like aspartic protease [Thiohalocapsa sp.]MCG6941053.1 retroviral-like aspartic protease family protein [Thiohalocapsa sp.]